MKSKIFTVFFLMNFIHLASQNTEWKKDITPFSNLGTNSLNSISGKNAFIQLGSILLTYGIIKSKTDYRVHNYFSRHQETFNASSIPAVYAGYLAPFALGGGLYLYGLNSNNSKTAAAGCVVIQASMLAWVETSILKAFTGRKNPDNYIYNTGNDASGKFNFGFMRNGIHYGWPSGHMAVSTAIISGLYTFYKDNNTVKIVSWCAWVYMIYGVIAHEGNTMHWFSDAITGSVMGLTIGTTVGNSFKQFYKKDNSRNLGFDYKPFANRYTFGINLSYTF